MPGIFRRRWLAAGLILSATSWHPARSQDAPPLPGPPPGVSGFPEGGAMLPPGPDGPAPGITDPPDCTCGTRRGPGRWWWHRTQCKRHLQEHFLGYLEEFNEWPLGASLYAHGKTQVANGEAAQMVFFHYDFIDGTSRLNVRGTDKLIRVAAQLPTCFAPILVERTPATPGLDQGRRLALLNELAKGPFPVPAERVVIGPPISYGLNGQEATITYGSQLNLLQGGGAGASAGAFSSGSAGSFSASGLSGSAVFGR